ncbi:hypothetical protein U9M48_002271 [Paspalum notatum var. saurae]|uniref:Uncharacterized protein n=1 Tax=Paspalum notatum var. saurae TaxID=547442 RepID=A0AAQ3SJN4_PASNO
MTLALDCTSRALDALSFSRAFSSTSRNIKRSQQIRYEHAFSPMFQSCGKIPLGWRQFGNNATRHKLIRQDTSKLLELSNNDLNFMSLLNHTAGTRKGARMLAAELTPVPGSNQAPELCDATTGKQLRHEDPPSIPAPKFHFSKQKPKGAEIDSGIEMLHTSYLCNRADELAWHTQLWVSQIDSRCDPVRNLIQLRQHLRLKIKPIPAPQGRAFQSEPSKHLCLIKWPISLRFVEDIREPVVLQSIFCSHNETIWVLASQELQDDGFQRKHIGFWTNGPGLLVAVDYGLWVSCVQECKPRRDLKDDLEPEEPNSINELRFLLNPDRIWVAQAGAASGGRNVRLRRPGAVRRQGHAPRRRPGREAGPEVAGAAEALRRAAAPEVTGGRGAAPAGEDAPEVAPGSCAGGRRQPGRRAERDSRAAQASAAPSGWAAEALGGAGGRARRRWRRRASRIFVLIDIDRSNNSLSGEFPCPEQNYKCLVFLDLARNNFSGTVPMRIGNLVGLHFLRLSHKKFSGEIPESITDLRCLQYLDIADNVLSGSLPRHLSSFTLMILNYWAGRPQETWPCNLYDPPSVYHGASLLSGELPEDLGNLNGLQILNLSWNQLSGNVPSRIGSMKSLESLDLSRNMLSREIPASLSNLTFLGYLDLSYNNLIGRIPSGTQLDTLYAYEPTMYDGNIGLCGAPLKRNCSSNNASIEQDHSRRMEETPVVELETFGLVLDWDSLWVFGKPWRFAYFHLFDKLHNEAHVFVFVNLARLTRKETTTN